MHAVENVMTNITTENNQTIEDKKTLSVFQRNEEKKEITFSYVQNGRHVPIYTFVWKMNQPGTYKVHTPFPTKIELITCKFLNEEMKKRIDNTWNYGDGYWTDRCCYYVMFDGRCAGYILEDDYAEKENEAFVFFNTDRIFVDKNNEDMTLGEWKRLFISSSDFEEIELIEN